MPGYVTEKIFDCMRAGCVPIYWGAPNVREFIDEGTFIDRAQFASDAELERYLRGVTEEEYGQFQEAIRAYLAGPRFARFLSPAFADTVIAALGL